MKSISVCLIVKDEEKVLARCLDCVRQFADQIVVVDTGSIDNTISIARKYTNDVYNFEWVDDFALARNFSFSKATCEYVMWLDADDVIDAENISKILDLKNNMLADCYMLKYNVGFRGDVVTHSFYRERILKNNLGFKWVGCVHECITPQGKIEYLDIAVNHKKLEVKDADRNLNIYINKLKHGELNPRELYYYARELYYHSKYEECIINMQKFLDKGGFVENMIDGLIIISDCYLIQQNNKLALYQLYKTFDYDTPRANVCCKIGDLFYYENKYNQAIYWYKLATTCQLSDKKGGFVENECYNYYPYLQLCVCYHKIGDNITANDYNELAGQYQPNDEVVVSNRKYFKKILNL